MTVEKPDAAQARLEPIPTQLRSECQEKTSYRPFAATLDFGSYPLDRRYPLGKPFEVFDPGWESRRVEPEIAETWRRVPDAFQGELQYRLSPHAFVYFRLGLRKDLAAWHDDPLGLNLPQSEKEVDLNEPSRGYFHVEGDFLDFTVGRFPIHWSPSPEFGLTLTDAVPYHDAARFTLKTPRIRYHFLVSALDPWLQGTPMGLDSSGVDYPAGSEEYLQRHYPSDLNQNAHRRVYDARIKTLVAHRLEANLGRLEAGITEMEIIGGKVPDLQDANPFVFFHNNFNDGYANLSLTLDANLRLPWGFSLAGEFMMDDVKYSRTEGEDGTPAITGMLAGLRHSFAAGPWLVFQSLHWIRTDPFLYGYLQPLNRLTSRHIHTSNFQHDGDPAFIDKFVVDYPMGYLRGGDARDFWYRMEAARGKRLSMALTLGWLAKGEVDTYTRFEEYYRGSRSSPSGVPEEEARIRLDGAWLWRPGIRFRGGLGWQRLESQAHLRGNDATRFQASGGASWTFP